MSEPVPTVSPFKLLSLLLCYPDDELLGMRAEIEAAAAELPVAALAEPLLAFLAAERGCAPERLQADYVATFDFDRRASLNLTYFVHGDRRQRGVALLRLKQLFERIGLSLADTGELPDHLPLLLELADIAGPDAGTELLRELRPALEVIGARLRERDSRYAHLWDALEELLGPATEEDRRSALRLAAQGPPAERVGLEPFAPPEAMTGSAA